MSTRIGVVVRVRPLLENEIAQNMQETKLFVNKKDNEICVNISDDKYSKTFKFDKVFDSQSTQEELFTQSNIPNLVSKVIEGYHSTIFAYGQTGSGKTYTMEGYEYKKLPNERGA